MEGSFTLRDIGRNTVREMSAEEVEQQLNAEGKGGRNVKPCKQPGCPNLITEGTLCKVHQQKLDKQRRIKRGKRLLDSHAWRKARAGYLAKHPLCEDCKAAGKTVLATEVHHKVRHHNNPVIFWDSSIWTGLCKSCHSSHTAKEVFSQ